MKDNYDCLVIGADPAGATAAALVADAGYSTLLVESERTPRGRPGESLMVESWRILQRLGLLSTMRDSKFVRNTGVRFVSCQGTESQSFFFAERGLRDEAAAWQLERPKFDQLLLSTAEAKGADRPEQTCGQELLLEADRVTGALVRTAGEAVRQVRCRVLVDAAGLTLRDECRPPKTVEPTQTAIWGLYRGARRECGEDGGLTLLLQSRQRDAWFWSLPLADDLTSIGVVGAAERLRSAERKPAAIFEDELVQCPALSERLMSAELASSIATAQATTSIPAQRAGPGWLLVGDAGGSWDPLFGSGLFLSMKGGELAADAVLAGLATNDLSAQQLGRWNEAFAAGAWRIRRLANIFCSPDFSFRRLVEGHPHDKACLTDLLMGRLFDPPAEYALEQVTRWLLPQGVRPSVPDNSTLPVGSP
jgi:flavin-dependent dehydrogenase